MPPPSKPNDPKETHETRTPAQGAPPVKDGMPDPMNASGSAGTGPQGTGQSGPHSGEQGREGVTQTPGGVRDRPGAAPQKSADASLSDVAGMIRDFTQAVKGNDWVKAYKAGSAILAAVAEVVGRRETDSPQAAAARAPRHEGAGGDFEKAATEFENAKGDAVAGAATVHLHEYKASGGPVAGTPVPLNAPTPQASLLQPGNVMTLIQLVSDAIDLFRRLGGK